MTPQEVLTAARMLIESADTYDSKGFSTNRRYSIAGAIRTAFGTHDWDVLTSAQTAAGDALKGLGYRGLFDETVTHADALKAIDEALAA